MQLHATSGARAALASLVRTTRHPPFRAGVLYLAVSTTSAVLGALIGSTSEYRFPHPLVATQLHLLISLATLLLVGATARTLDRRRGARRALTSANAPISRTLHSLSSLLSCGSPASLAQSAFSPFTLSAALFSTLASLLETRAHGIVDPAFFAFARLLPLVVCASLSLVLPRRLVPGPLDGGQDTVAYVLLWLVFVAGKGVSMEAGRGGWPVALGWAAGAVGWVLSIHGGQLDSRRESGTDGGDEEGKTRTAGSPTLLSHLALSILLLTPPTLVSTEFADIRRSRHYAFFLEPGFWAQEAGIALLSLAGLGAFWCLVSTCAPLPVFALVATKDLVLLPHAYSALLGNPLDAVTRGEGALGGRTHAVMLVLVGAWLLAGATGQQGERDDRGRRKEG